MFIFSMLVQFPGWSNKYGPCCTLENEEPTNSGTVVQNAREDIWSQVSTTALIFSQKILTNSSSLKKREAHIKILVDSFWGLSDFLSFSLTVSYVLYSHSQRKEAKIMKILARAIRKWGRSSKVNDLKARKICVLSWSEASYNWEELKIIRHTVLCMRYASITKEDRLDRWNWDYF